MSITDLIRPAVMTPLAQQVVERGMCSKCHKKTLKHVHSCEHFSSWQCTTCKHVFMLEPVPSDSAAGQP